MIEYALVTGNSVLTTILGQLKPATKPIRDIFAKIGISLSSEVTLMIIVATMIIVFGMLFFSHKR